jgi:hypothetical protein
MNFYSEAGYPDDEPEFIAEALELIRINDANIREHILPFHPEINYLGVGAESIVIGDPHEPDRVISYKFVFDPSYPPFDLLEKYHMHNVLNLLYPEYFPKIINVSDEFGRTVRSRVKDFVPVSAQDNLNLSHEIMRKVRSETHIRIGLDYIGKNFVYQTESDQYKYLDLLTNKVGTFKGNLDLILSLFHEKSCRGLAIEQLEALKARGSAGAKHLISKRNSLLYSLKRITELAIMYEAFSAGTEEIEDLMIYSHAQSITEKQLARIKRDLALAYAI